MAEREELETLVYCLGPVGGKENNVITEGSSFYSKDDYTKKGYARFITEANNVIKFQEAVIKYFMESVKTDVEEDALAFIDSEIEEGLKASIHKMKKHWKEMFKDHQKELRSTLKSKNPKKIPAIEDFSEESNSNSSAKIRRLDREASSEASPKTSKSDSDTTSETGEKNPKSESPDTNTDGVPVEQFAFPESIFVNLRKEFHRMIKEGYHELKERMGKFFERFSTKENEVQDLKGFTYLKMGKFAKWKYTLKTLNLLVLELEKKFGELDLDLNEKKENEKRLTDWLYFDDGKMDRKYHHRLLIPMELTGPIEEVSAIAHKQLLRYKKLINSLESKLPLEYEKFKAELWNIRCVVFNRPEKPQVGPKTSNDSGDTMFDIDDMPEET